MASQAITQLEIGNRLSEAFFTGGHVRIFPLCFLINVADGYDMVSMAYAAPATLIAAVFLKKTIWREE